MKAASCALLEKTAFTLSGPVTRRNSCMSSKWRYCLFWSSFCSDFVCSPAFRRVERSSVCRPSKSPEAIFVPGAPAGGWRRPAFPSQFPSGPAQRRRAPRAERCREEDVKYSCGRDFLIIAERGGRKPVRFSTYYDAGKTFLSSFVAYFSTNGRRAF